MNAAKIDSIQQQTGINLRKGNLTELLKPASLKYREAAEVLALQA
ncbi:hypothetical protein G159_04225 [Planococcus glaciei CHR43]|nr:hypothetical protein G159_04225 [Planococcus glaciei CHR43]